VSGLFIALYLDEDVDVLLADLVRARGLEAATTIAEGQGGNTDAEQLAFALTQQRTLLTHNRADFEHLAQEYFAAGRSHFGIIIANRHPVYDLARRLLVILNAVTADEMQNQVRYI
jgi:hypothetical protein